MIISVDPGKTTGLAVYNPVSRAFKSWQEPDVRMVFILLNALKAHDFVVAESYTINAATAKLSPQMDALYVLGAIHSNSCTIGTPFVLQTPSQGKSFGTDAKLKHLGWWHPTRGGHANDAARHLLRHWVIERQDVTLTDKLREMV